MIRNLISIDLENWFSGKDIFKKFLPGNQESQLDKSMPQILDLLNRYNTKATFFVLGETAEKQPEIIKKIYEEGHEIASHGYRHVSLSKLGPEEFEEDIINSVNLIKKITGKKPIGFRAPMFSLNNDTKWALPILEKYGFKYDSSIFPFMSRYYGIEGIPKNPYRINFEDVRKEDKASNIIEYPIKIKKLVGIPFIITGGFYLRFYPVSFIKYMIRYYNKQNERIILYFHPWETYKDTPKVRMDYFSKFITYYNLKGTLNKVENLLNSFKFRYFEKDLMEK